jgi:hypothetical protein
MSMFLDASYGNSNPVQYVKFKVIGLGGGWSKLITTTHKHCKKESNVWICSATLLSSLEFDRQNVRCSQLHNYIIWKKNSQTKRKLVLNSRYPTLRNMSFMRLFVVSAETKLMQRCPKNVTVVTETVLHRHRECCKLKFAIQWRPAPVWVSCHYSRLQTSQL